MRAVGLDLGERRIGVAVSDSRGVLATPYGVVERSGDAAGDRRVLAAIVEEVGAGVVVVGMPLSLSGEAGTAARAASAEAEELGRVLTVPVTTFDERLTTVEAARRRRERAAVPYLASSRRRGAGAARPPGDRPRGDRPRGAAARAGIDAEAAAVMLGAWLEARPR